jgi:DNA-binding XRE family transcriptional regulator
MSNNLQEERKRLHLVASEVWENIGASRATYTRWEAGSPIPSDKLALLAELGFDVAYVVTGKRQTINEQKLRDSLDVLFTVLDVMKETGDGISNERAAQIVAMIYDLLAKGKQIDSDDIQLITKLAS